MRPYFRKRCVVVNGERICEPFESCHESNMSTSSRWTLTKLLNLNLSELLTELTIYLQLSIWKDLLRFLSFIGPFPCRGGGHVGVDDVRWDDCSSLSNLTQNKMVFYRSCVWFMAQLFFIWLSPLTIIQSFFPNRVPWGPKEGAWLQLSIVMSRLPNNWIL